MAFTIKDKVVTTKITLWCASDGLLSLLEYMDWLTSKQDMSLIVED